MLDAVVGHERCRFLDGFNGYNQIHMQPDDQEKITFVTEWGGCHDVRVKDNVSHIPTDHYRDFRWMAFMQVFPDDFAVYDRQVVHLDQLHLCLERCR